MSTNGLSKPAPQAAAARRELELYLHVSEYSSETRGPLYTVSVWDNRLSPPGLRALCHVRPLSDALFAIAAEIAATQQKAQKPERRPRWADVAPLVERLVKRNDPDSAAAADEIRELIGIWHNANSDLESALDRLWPSFRRRPCPKQMMKQGSWSVVKRRTNTRYNFSRSRSETIRTS